MCAMEVKKNGKVEHSSNSHDDSVFSYLHALYIWYDGENLVEKFNLQKNTIKTDEDVEIMESEFENQIEKKEKIDLKELELDSDSELIEAYQFIEEGIKFKTSRDLDNEIFLSDIAARDKLLSLDKAARDSYAEQTGLDPSMFGLDANNNNLVQLPDDLFTDGVSSDFMFDDENYRSNQVTPLAGNMSDWWNRV